MRGLTSGNWPVIVNLLNPCVNLLELDLLAIAIYHFTHLRGGFEPYSPQMEKKAVYKKIK